MFISFHKLCRSLTQHTERCFSLCLVELDRVPAHISAGNKALWDSGPAEGGGERARLSVKRVRWSRMWLVEKRNHKGQSLIEYAMVAAIVSAAVIAMSTYVYRAVQATQQMIQEEARSD